MSKYILGIDIGGTFIKAGLCKLDDECFVEEWKLPTDRFENGKNVIRDIARSVDQVREVHDIAVTDILGLGFAVPGVVDQTGRVVKCVNLGWEDKHLDQEVKAIFPHMKAVVGNDANVAALGEMWKGSGTDAKDLVFITLGTGVGGGVILDSRIVTGVFGSAGEIGHLHVEDGEKVSCACGRKGCLEQYASATGIVRLMQEEAYKAQSSVPSDITSEEIFDLARNGFEPADAAITRAAHYLGKAMAQVSAVIDPQVYLIGGGVSGAGDYLLEKVRAEFKAQCLFSSREADIRLASLGNRAGVCGAVKLAMDACR